MIHNTLDDGLTTLISDTACHAVTCGMINQMKDGNLVEVFDVYCNNIAIWGGGGRRKRLQVSHFSHTEVTNSSIFLSATPDFLIKSINLSGLGCANCLCSLRIFRSFALSSFSCNGQENNTCFTVCLISREIKGTHMTRF